MNPYDIAEYIEPDFPFFSSVLDCRELGEGFPKDNLTPRGLILNLGHNLWACFDIDLLRIACVWESEPGKPPITLDGLAPGSYHIAGQKTKDGEDILPKPVGKVWLANGLYPGWQVGDKVSFTDPREPAPSKEELGRGPLTEKQGRFQGIAFTPNGVVLRMMVNGTNIVQNLRAVEEQGTWVVELQSVIGSGQGDLKLVLGSSGNKNPTVHSLKVEEKPHLDRVLITASGIRDQANTDAKKAPKVAITERHWKGQVTTTTALSTKDEAFVTDLIGLPTTNPWKRNIRLADIDFLDDQGNAAGVTFDGDVWLISGLKGNLDKVTWRRFASGLHEPMSIVARRNVVPGADPQVKANDLKSGMGGPLPEIFVFDRNGIWKLSDTNGDGEADVHEMFCNLFAQTAETREFPNSMKLGPDGSFIISKGGQQGSYLGKHNGTVIKVAPDGKSFEVLGYGLRQPFIGVNSKTGLVVASDQEGNYVPTTPIHVIKDHQFYGHLATIQPHEEYPQSIADPLTWIPHSVVPSGATLMWLNDAKLGPANNEMVLISYNKPELHRVLENHRTSRPQGTVVPWMKNFDFPTLNAHINPADGQLYVCGFQVWGTTVKTISGLARVRYTDKPRILLTECTPCDKGVLLRFNEPLDKTLATNPDSYNVERWSYKRTFNYGSPHLKADGTPGTEWMAPSSAYLSKDGKSVFIGLPEMKTTYMQMRVGYGLKGDGGLPAQNNAYFTPYELVKFEPEKEGFDKLEVDLTPRKVVAAAQVKPTLEEGKRLYEMMGCMACHSIDGTTYAKVGPSWKGLFGTERVLSKGGVKATADEAYLKESIQNPPAKVVKGYEKLDAGMPIYAGVLNDSQIDSLILFIKSLK
ncbi:MAG: c-type cytochrome [Verrucomicrobiaceae bacterium]|nr:c-type cytochrome [Verrucomicrobiaceae bacterium]